MITWQLLLACYVLLNTATYLLQRKLGQKLAKRRRLVSGFFMLGIHYPIGLLVAAYSSPHLAIGWLNIALLVVGSWVFPLINILTIQASKTVDADHFTILSNLTPIITIVAATLLLHESLHGHQIVAAVLILASAFLITLPRLRQSGRSKTTGISLALLVFLLAGVATVYERWMLTRVDIGAYLVFGWGAQSLWMALVAWPERKHLKTLKNRKSFVTILSFSLVSSLKGVCFIAALRLSGNASVFSAFTGFTAVLVVPAAYIFLHERRWLLPKLAIGSVATSGIIILNLK